MRRRGSTFLPVIIITFLIGIVGYLTYQNTHLKRTGTNWPFQTVTTITQTSIPDKIPCGGWDTFGEVVCKCSGKIEKFSCPSNTICDSGRNSCTGTCGECKCYQGSLDEGLEIPCNSRQDSFK